MQLKVVEKFSNNDNNLTNYYLDVESSDGVICLRVNKKRWKRAEVGKRVTITRIEIKQGKRIKIFSQTPTT